jgi:hypothetical protein
MILIDFESFFNRLFASFFLHGKSKFFLLSTLLVSYLPNEFGSSIARNVQLSKENNTMKDRFVKIYI